jgi:hypothetical protein
MVLHRTNFEIPAQFSFKPYSADWRLVSAEIVDWVEAPRLMMALVQEDPREKTWLRVRLEMPDSHENTLGALYGLGDYRSYMVQLDRCGIPPDVLPAHENNRNAPDVSGRLFQVLICEKPEFKEIGWSLKHGGVTKNAWIMRDEFLNLEADSELGWDWSARQFLNKWGIWEYDNGYVKDRSSAALRMLAPSKIAPVQKIERPGFIVVLPHRLKEQQAKYRKALLPSNVRPWLRSHPLSLDAADGFPFYRVLSSICKGAIETTITIDHLAERQFGICKRCHKVFQKETRHKKKYCSERCFNAAGIQRWREKQRKLRKGNSRNAKG